VTAPQPAAPVTYEEMLSLVRARRRARLIMRRELQRNGGLADGLYDREQIVWARLETFIAKCLVRRAEVSGLVNGVAVRAINDETDEA